MRTNNSVTVNVMNKNDRKKTLQIAILLPVVMIQYYINETENPVE